MLAANMNFWCSIILISWEAKLTGIYHLRLAYPPSISICTFKFYNKKNQGSQQMQGWPLNLLFFGRAPANVCVLVISKFTFQGNLTHDHNYA